MNKRLVANLSLVVAMAVLLVALKDTWARPTSAFDQINLLVDMRHELTTEYVESPDQQKLIEGAIRGMIESLDDPYTAFLPKSEFQDFEQNIRGEFSGIGAEVTIDNNRLQIVTPLEDSPAWEAGVMAGDTVLEIDGTDTLDMKITDAIKMLKGPKGTDVKLKVRHESGEEQEIVVTRDQIKVRTVRGFSRDADHHYQYMIDPERKIGYVRLTQFNDRTATELAEALHELKEAEVAALILDMRFNPGGLLESAVQISDMFLTADQDIVSVKGRVVNERTFTSSEQTLLPDVPIVVLANTFSASAAEIVTGALSDNDRALFVGERTFGKGSVQQIKMLNGDAGALKITNAYYYLPSGRNIHRRSSKDTWGVDPSEGAYVPMSPDDRREMIRARREADLVTQENGSAATPMSPEQIDEQLKDPQLAAALQAALGKLDAGEWPTVGQSNADALARTAEIASLEKQRELLESSLAELNERIARVEGGDVDSGEPESVGTIMQEEGGPVDAITDEPDADDVEAEPAPEGAGTDLEGAGRELQEAAQ